MASNKDTVLRFKNNSGNYIAINPVTKKSQVIAWNAGEIKGPYILTLKATDWIRNKQTIDLNGLSSEDIVDCTKVLEGTKEQMIAQNEAYNQLRLVGGVQSLNNQIMFFCDKTPEVDFKVQIYWTK